MLRKKVWAKPVHDFDVHGGQRRAGKRGKCECAMFDVRWRLFDSFRGVRVGEDTTCAIDDPIHSIQRQTRHIHLWIYTDPALISGRGTMPSRSGHGPSPKLCFYSHKKNPTDNARVRSMAGSRLMWEEGYARPCKLPWHHARERRRNAIPPAHA